MIELVARRVDEIVKSSGKGKKKLSPRILAFAAELNSAKEGLRRRAGEVVEMLDRMITDDAELDWTLLADGFSNVGFRDRMGFGGRSSLFSHS